MQPDNSESLIRNLAELDSRQLISIIIDDYQDLGSDFILPNPYANDECLEVFHNRIQRIQDVPELQPENIEDKLVAGLTTLYPDKTPQESFDKLFNARKTGLLKGDTLSQAGISKTEQLLIARGVYIASTSRIDEDLRNGKQPSQTQLRLQQVALNHIKHTRTNPVHVPQGTDIDDQNTFMGAYMASYIAGIVEEEVKPQGVSKVKSIVEAMKLPIMFGAVLSGDSDERQSIFAEGEVMDSDSGDTSVFVKSNPAEIDEERIKDLRKIQFSFGNENSRFTYYETTNTFKKGSKGKKDRVKELSSQRENTIPQETYTVMVIDDPSEDGRVFRHAVAENKQVGNACYGLRQEILDEWEGIIGVRMTWQDIFYPKRMIARQIGAKVFTHSANSNVPKRLLDYLNQDSDSVVYETFSKIFDRDAGLFDDDMNPTEKNIMPKYIIEAIQSSRTLLQIWPSIREHGYSVTYRMLRNIEISESKKPANRRSSPARKLSLVDRALEIFSAAAEAEAKEKKHSR